VHLADGSGRIRCVVKDAMGIHEVKRAVGERQVLSVALDETSFQVGQLKTSLVMPTAALVRSTAV